jgi:SAM-dependent methyltransferase
MTAIYDRIGVGYAELRRPDPRIAAVIAAACQGTVLNVGAGAGSYEPVGTMAAVEPSAVMVGQRPEAAAPAVRAVAEALPFADGAFDTALAVLTTHHWTDAARGLQEMARVSRRQVVLTWDAAFTRTGFWVLSDYLPEVADREEGLAHLTAVRAAWPDAQVSVVPVPWDCTDGFFAAYWRRPEAYFSDAVRAAISGFALADPDVVARALQRLRTDLDSGAWARQHADLLDRTELDCGYRLVVRG